MKELALQHAEKAVLAVCLLLMLFFVYNSFSVEGYKRTPEDFSKVAQSARKNVEGTQPKTDELKSADLPAAANQLGQPIDPQPYANRTSWLRPFDFGLNFRKEPEILKPNRPKVQDNRGLIALYKTDYKGKRITRKNKSSERTGHAVDKEREQAHDQFSLLFGGQGMGGAPSGSGDSSGMMGPMGGGRGAGRGMMGAGVGSGTMGGSSEGSMRGGTGMSGMGMGMSSSGMGMNSGMGMGMFGGNEGMMGMGGMSPGMGGGMEGMGGGGAPPAETKPVMKDRKSTITLTENVLKKGGKKDEKSKKDEKKAEDSTVEEYVVGMVAKHWVEVVASFPHAEQIKKYVQSLREPAAITGLRYAMADVERRELDANLEWTNWAPIPLGEQFHIIENAIAFQPEDYPQVMIKGLAMNIPLLQTTYKPFLIPDDLKEPEIAQYSNEELNPLLADANKPKKSGRRHGRQTNTLKAKKEEKKKDEKNVFNKSSSRVDLSSKGLEKDEKNKDAKDRTFNNRYLVKNAMIRFWDFTVQPGRKYQYRLRVNTFNPNYNHDDVASAEFSTSPWLTGPWSDSSDEVYVEPDEHWYVTKQDTRGDDTARLQIQKWDQEIGEWMTLDSRYRLGDLIGVSGTTKKPIEMVRWDDRKNEWLMENLAANDRFNSNCILLDVSTQPQRNLSVRERVASNPLTVKVPREVVAVNQYGDLIRRNEADDRDDGIRKAIEEGYKNLIKELKTASATPKEGENQMGGDPVPPGGGRPGKSGRGKAGKGGGGSGAGAGGSR